MSNRDKDDINFRIVLFRIQYISYLINWNKR